MAMVLWKYRTLPHRGRCKIDGEVIDLQFTLEQKRWLNVLEIEEYIREMCQDASTVELYTQYLADRFRCVVIGEGETRTHGMITCVWDGREVTP